MQPDIRRIQGVQQFQKNFFFYIYKDLQRLVARKQHKRFEGWPALLVRRPQFSSDCWSRRRGQYCNGGPGSRSLPGFPGAVTGDAATWI
jgi:hypothetical protein